MVLRLSSNFLSKNLQQTNSTINSFKRSTIDSIGNLSSSANIPRQIPQVPSFGRQSASIDPIQSVLQRSQLNFDFNQLTNVSSNVTNQINQATASLSPASKSFGQFSNIIPNSIGNIGGLVNNVTGNLQNSIGSITSALNSATNIISGINDFVNNPTKLINQFSTKFSSLIDANITPISSTIENISKIGTSISASLGAGSDITVVQRGLNEISAAVGGKFETFRTQLENTTAFTNIAQAAEESLFSQSVLTANGQSKIPNPLRNFNHYNYIITLGVLTPEQNNFPDTYRKSGKFSRILVRSGGGSYNTRVQSYDEGSDHMEFHIDDLEVDAVIAPNNNTSVALGTTVRFKILEPFSMGKFLENAIIAATESGFPNYIDAPFCLKIEFVGWSEDGTTARDVPNPFFVPIKFTNMDFDVTDSGSRYEVEAVVSSDIVHSEQHGTIKSPVNLDGDTVNTILETGKKSLTRSLNGRHEVLEENNLVVGFDRYVILFPKERDDLINALRTQSVDTSTLRETAEKEEAQRLGLARDELQLDDPDSQVSAIPTLIGGPDLYYYLKAYANDTSKMNSIGLSTVIDDIRSDGNHPQPEANQVYDDAILRGARTSNAEMSVAENSRDIPFTEGESIQKIIEEIVVNSQYMINSATKDFPSGFKPHFRIETQVFIDDNSAITNQIGRPRRIYTYVVHESSVRDTKLLAPTEKPKKVAELKEIAAKEYNYIYTGLNEDVLDFEIKFNHAFFQTAFADFGLGRTGLGGETASTGEIAAIEYTPAKNDIDAAKNLEPAPEMIDVLDLSTQTSGGIKTSLNSDNKRQISRMFHDRIINSNVDMITTEMEIWGDPYFLPTDLGNNQSTPLTLTTTTEGTMSYITDPVFVVVNFKTPVDYEQNGYLMKMPQDVASFSGLYQVWASTASFSSGKFTQRLKMIREIGQNDEATESKGYVRLSEEVTKTPKQQSGNPGNTSNSQNRTGSGTDFVGTGVSNQPMVPIGRSSSARPIGSLPNIRPGDETNALDAIAADRETLGLNNAAPAAVVTSTGSATDPRIGVFGRDTGSSFSNPEAAQPDFLDPRRASLASQLPLVSSSSSPAANPDFLDPRLSTTGRSKTSSSTVSRSPVSSSQTNLSNKTSNVNSSSNVRPPVSSDRSG